MYTTGQIRPYLENYAAVTGRVTDRFICPITLRPCELSEIVKAHIVNDKVGYEHNTTVPAFGRIDHFFGSKTEARFVRALNLVNGGRYADVRGIVDMYITIGEGGPRLRCSVVKNEKIAKAKEHFQVIHMEDEKGELAIALNDVHPCDPRVQFAEGSLANLDFITGSDSPAYAISAIKAAYLALFSMLGYRVAFDPSTDPIRRALASSYHDDATLGSMTERFRPYLKCADLVLDQHEKIPMDILRDKKIIFHRSQGTFFAASLYFKLKHATIGVTLPQGINGADAVRPTTLYDQYMETRRVPSHTFTIDRFDGDSWVREGPQGKLRL